MFSCVENYLASLVNFTLHGGNRQDRPPPPVIGLPVPLQKLALIRFQKADIVHTHQIGWRNPERMAKAYSRLRPHVPHRVLVVADARFAKIPGALR